jgi:signal transduction histidine kinase
MNRPPILLNVIILSILCIFAFGLLCWFLCAPLILSLNGVAFFALSGGVFAGMMAGCFLGGMLRFPRKFTRSGKDDEKISTEFVSLVAHQLRSPLANINWYAELLGSPDWGKLTKEQREFLSEIYHNSKRMTELVNALLDISRLKLGTFVPALVPVDIPWVAEGVIHEMEHQFVRKKIILNKLYDGTLPKLNADAKLLRIIFQNLLSNALKYTSKGGIISLVVEKDATHVLIKVSDSGCGIPKEDQSKIFSQFFRAENALATAPEGSGLGLSIVKSILEYMNGTIRFESKEHIGTTFYVTIPLVSVKMESMKENKK